MGLRADRMSGAGGAQATRRYSSVSTLVSSSAHTGQALWSGWQSSPHTSRVAPLARPQNAHSPSMADVGVRLGRVARRVADGVVQVETGYRASCRPLVGRYRGLVGGGIFSVWPICSFCGSSIPLADIKSSVLIRKCWAIEAGVGPTLTAKGCLPAGRVRRGGGGRDAARGGRLGGGGRAAG